jgi:hypothetical protein
MGFLCGCLEHKPPIPSFPITWSIFLGVFEIGKQFPMPRPGSDPLFQKALLQNLRLLRPTALWPLHSQPGAIYCCLTCSSLSGACSG